VTLIIRGGINVHFHQPRVRGIQVLGDPFSGNQYFGMFVISHFDFSFLALKKNLVGPKNKKPTCHLSGGG
jgi:hypothetical protein